MGLHVIIIFATEIDECALGMHVCPPDYPCRNTFGAYDCDCNQTGWYFNFKLRTCESKDSGIEV